ncbi:hypothetical protein [Bacillus sp. UMB0893]|uniref:hypothetical protein n=1 Tax=Bacillus sp. UMB0893 TaxID=2066053 RepID=UPI0015DD78F0|nr:hypothetical protein [Bacillus sp. UMB0893]
MNKEKKDSLMKNKDNHAHPNYQDISGDSIDELRNEESANILLGGDEIKQQNENL